MKEEIPQPVEHNFHKQPSLPKHRRLRSTMAEHCPSRYRHTMHPGRLHRSRRPHGPHLSQTVLIHTKIESMYPGSRLDQRIRSAPASKVQLELLAHARAQDPHLPDRTSKNIVISVVLAVTRLPLLSPRLQSDFQNMEATATYMKSEGLYLGQRRITCHISTMSVLGWARRNMARCLN